jgi:RNA polymerase-binding protein DksA
MRLQRAAVEAIRAGMQQVDEQIKKQRRWRGKTPPQAQVALVALDPHTGEVRALAGGRNYGMSQLNHVLSKRQPGSIFKPFVYAAALNTGLSGNSNPITISTTVVDEPTVFSFDNQTYSPKNFDGKFKGVVQSGSYRNGTIVPRPEFGDAPIFALVGPHLKDDLLSNAGETTEHLREDTSIVPDPADRATIEEEHALELRTRDRERKLLKKISQSLGRIEAGDYGFCDETGEPIGLGRLIARPTATLSLEAQQRRELKQKMFGD